MLYAIVVVLIMILDQGLKYWTTLHLELNTGLKELIPGLIHLRNYHNTGSAFSFLQNWDGARWLFLVVTVLFAVLVAVALAKKLISGTFGRWMAVCVLAGALGNGVDRALHGYVVDMLQFGFWESFPIFNVADIFITLGGILFCLYVILHKEPIKAPDSKAMRKGPGGSVTTKAAPKRVEKPPKMPKEKPARVIRPQPQEETPKVPPAAARPRRTVRPDSGPDIAQVRRPAAARESFTEMTRHKPGDDPFAEWTQPKAPPVPSAEQPPVREVRPEPVAPEPAVTEPKPAAVEPKSAAVEPIRPVSAPDVNEDMEFSLEDILNEFRDL